jgi:hypothetical protein
MAAERNFWQVLIVGSRYEAGVYMRVLEYPSRELADETIAAVNLANNTLVRTYLGAFPLYPAKG